MNQLYIQFKNKNRYCKEKYMGESINYQPNTPLINRDFHDFPASFQYMYYTWVQSYTCIRSFACQILNVKHVKARISSTVEYRAVIRYFYLKGKTGADIYADI